jgi:hypothetical protein
MYQDHCKVSLTDDGASEGLSWSWHLDLETLLTALAEPAPWNRPPAPAPGPAGCADAGSSDAGSEDVRAGESEGLPVDPVEAEFADYLDAVDADRATVVPLSAAAGRVAEVLPTSPDLAAWLACHSAGDLEDVALAGTAAAYRRLAAWAQAGELAAIAQMASRSAAADTKAGTGQDGRPRQIPADAYGQVSLALTLSQSGAQWWTNLAVDLQWRLAATGVALREGTIDLSRAKAIAEATAPLNDDKARAVEAKVLPRAGEQTTGQLRARLRRAVIMADPEGAERRREEAERRARVTLYPDAEGTASLGGQSLPGIRAAAAMARITALARALKATGAGGGIDLLRSKVFLGLLLGTLPYIPPPPDGPADSDCPPGADDPPGASGPPGPGCPPSDLVGSGSGRRPGSDCSPGGPADADADADADAGAGSGSGSGGPPAAGPSTGGAASDAAGRPIVDDWPWSSDPVTSQTEAGSGCDSAVGGDVSIDAAAGDDAAADKSSARSEEDAPVSEEWPQDDGQPGSYRPAADAVDDGPGSGPVPWPEVTPVLAPGPAALKNLQPAGSGFLDLRLPWCTLAHGGPEPGYLTRLGPVTPAQASYLALLAAADPAVEWRVVLTNGIGQAIAARKIRTRRSRAGPPSAGPASTGSLVRRITVIIPIGEVASTDRNDQHTGGSQRMEGSQWMEGSQRMEGNQRMVGGLPAVLAAILDAAREAARQADARAVADAAVGGCAHTQASPAYQVPARLRDYVNLRDLTCRFPTCRQPAWRCDTDHTHPYDQDGLTCSCNLGPLCRYHHQLKQHPLWHLDQPVPGTFIWTTPTGRTYTTQPDQQAA